MCLEVKLPEGKALSDTLGLVDVTKVRARTKVQEILGTMAFLVVGLNKNLIF